MKKLFTSMLLLAGSLAATATDYPGTLVVVIDGSVAQPTKTQIVIDEQADGKYGLTLKNFILVQGGQEMAIGNIVLSDVEARTEETGATVLETKQDIIIQDGDAEGVPMWFGPALGEVPVELRAVVNGDILTADIAVPIVGQDVNVVFDSRQFQLPNAGFEDFHTAKAGNATSDEPNNWHSFMSCTGDFASIVSSVPHTFISEDTRPGSDGSKSVLVKSGKVLGMITANGTLTTGQLQAGGMTASDTKNNAFLDLSNTERDANGDPFYTTLNTLPDSIGVWVKFKQGEPVEDHSYATMSAVITNGAYYQEPCDKDYSDVIVGKAECKTIESTGEWQKIVVPFDYNDEYKGQSPKGILVTFSTNADAGQGTDNDELYIDDVELVYSSYLSDLSVNGTPLPGFAPDKYAYEYAVAEGTTADELADMIGCRAADEAKVFVSVANNTVSVTVLSADLQTSRVYTIKAVTAAGVESIVSSDNAGKTVYSLVGQKVSSMRQGGVYIMKYANGKTVKSVGRTF